LKVIWFSSIHIIHRLPDFDDRPAALALHGAARAAAFQEFDQRDLRRGRIQSRPEVIAVLRAAKEIATATAILLDAADTKQGARESACQD